MLRRSGTGFSWLCVCVAASGNQIDYLRNTTEHARLSALCRWAGALTHKKVGGGAIQPAAPFLPFPFLPIPSLPFNRPPL